MLASLQHPSIVRVVDAGRTMDGEPFLVMEYVRGEPVDTYAARLPLADRLALFMKICDGVSHAHAHLVVHRDLKPSNILVDRSGQPKLLDFGIARLLDDTGDATRTIDRVLTPTYASPEQFSGAVPTVATDVYSLGAVLYKLLTGRTTHEARGGSNGSPQFAADGRDIPSATRLDPALPSDLDFILRKALRFEPEERYASVEAFANDVRALLELRPVAARAGDSWYRTRKFVRRYRLPVSVSVLGIASLSAGLVAANRQRRIAERRFRQVRHIANQFIALDADIRTLPGSTTARHRIVSESLKYLAGLGAEARGDTELALEIANAYLQVASVQGVPFVANLGQYAEAEQSLRSAARFAEAVLHAEPRNSRAWFISAQIGRGLMAVLDYQDRRGEALEHAARAADQLERFLGLDAPGPDDINTATHVYLTVATAYTNSNRLGEAIRYSRRAIEVSTGVDAARMRRASAFGVLSVSLRRAGELDEALAAARGSIQLLEQRMEDDSTDHGYNLYLAYLRAGLVLDDDRGIGLGRSDEAVDAFRNALRITRGLASRDPRDSRCRVALANAARQLGDILRHREPAEALAIYDDAIAQLTAVRANPRLQREHVYLLASSSYPARSVEGNDAARRRIDRALAILREAGQYPSDAIEPDSEPAHVVRALADHYAATGQIPNAIDTYQDLAARMTAGGRPIDQDLRDTVALSNLLWDLAGALRRADRTAESSRVLARRTALWESWTGRLPNNAFVRSHAHRRG